MCAVAQSNSTRRQPEQQAPPVQKLRMRYAKRGPARFTSHRDFSRAFERALRRAEVPMAYSSGFHPHPRISYANASPTSAATEAEYLEIGLGQVCDPHKVMAALNEVLPPGLRLLDVIAAHAGSIGDELTASAWRLDLGAQAEPALLEQAVAALLASDQVSVQRMTKTGLREFDVRSAVMLLRVCGPGQLELIVQHTAPLVRPDDVVQALRALVPELGSQRPALLTRLAQGGVVAGDPEQLTDPFTGVPVSPFESH